MAWQKKEKELSKDEALKIAIDELTPLWFGSKPLVAGVSENGKTTAHPLDKQFISKNWLILFWDPSIYNGLNAINMITQWKNRYGKLDFNILSVINTSLSIIRDSREIKKLISNFKLDFPVTNDPEQDLMKAFGVEKLPSCIFLSKGSIAFRAQGEEIYKFFETDLQKFYRKDDPGIPFSPILLGPKDRKIEIRSDNLGTKFKPKLLPWEKIPEAIREPEIDWDKIPGSPIVVRGTWAAHEEYIVPPTQVLLYFSNAHRKEFR